MLAINRINSEQGFFFKSTTNMSMGSLCLYVVLTHLNLILSVYFMVTAVT